MFRVLLLSLMMYLSSLQQVQSAGAAESGKQPYTPYLIGPDDILEIKVLQPEEITSEATVAPDGAITFPYLGSVMVKDRTLDQVQADIQKQLSEGYLRYPVVSVSLKESRSKRFFVYGEVQSPGVYPLDSNMTVFKAISVAGGFTKYGSSSRVKILRPKKDGQGNETLKVDIKAVVDGSTQADITLEAGDVVIVSEGVF